MVSAFRRTDACYDPRHTILDARAAAYRDAARLYCGLIESHRQLSRAAFVKELEPSLAFLYYTGSRLPDVRFTASSDSQPEDKRKDVFPGLLVSLSAFLRDYDVYQEMFDPLDLTDTPVTGHLAGDLAEIYEDSMSNLKLLDHLAEDALWDVRFSFTNHWARHVASALRVVSALVHYHYASEADD